MFDYGIFGMPQPPAQDELVETDEYQVRVGELMGHGFDEIDADLLASAGVPASRVHFLLVRGASLDEAKRILL